MDIESLRKFCMNLPGTTEDIKWGNDLCFSVGNKMYCVCSLEDSFRVSFKVPDEDFDELCTREGFVPAPYMARAKWVMVTKPSILKKKDWESFVKTSHKFVAAKLAKKLQLQLGITL